MAEHALCCGKVKVEGMAGFVTCTDKDWISTVVLRHLSCSRPNWELPIEAGTLLNSIATLAGCPGPFDTFLCSDLIFSLYLTKSLVRLILLNEEICVLSCIAKKEH